MERERRNKLKKHEWKDQLELFNKTLRDTEEAYRMREERIVGYQAEKVQEDMEPYMPHGIDALPKLKRTFKKLKPLPGVSYLKTTGLYDELME